MKLSLTAIAALSAASFHPTVATGTRAASSNGNTEEKPGRNRDLFIGDPLDAFALKSDALKKFAELATGNDFANEAAEAKVVVQLVKANLLSESILAMYGSEQAACGGSRAISVDDFIPVTSGQVEIIGEAPIDNIDDDNNDFVCPNELTQALFLLPSENLMELSQVIAGSMMVLGNYR